MSFIDIFSIISGTASIIGLIISIVIASKVTIISKSNNQIDGQIQQGDGNQKVATDHSVIGEGQSVHYDYRNANVIGEIDELPILNKSNYPITANDYDKYSFGVSSKISEIIDIGNNDVIVISSDFTNIKTIPDEIRFIGYSLKALPMNDWRSFILENYYLSFTYNSIDTIKEMWIEITNKHQNIKLYKEKIELLNSKTNYSLSLNRFSSVIDTWKHVDEICFVFFPEDCLEQQGIVYITNLEICKK